MHVYFSNLFVLRNKYHSSPSADKDRFLALVKELERRRLHVAPTGNGLITLHLVSVMVTENVTGEMHSPG